MCEREILEHGSNKRGSKKDFLLTCTFGFIGLVYFTAALVPVWKFSASLRDFVVDLELARSDGSNDTAEAPAPFESIGFWSMTIPLILIWPAASHFVMATAYFGNQRMGIRCLNKDLKTGQIPCARFCFSLPWLITVYSFWFLRHLFNGEDAYNRVYKHFFVGRFPRSNSEFPAGIKNIVDLTTEFSARSSLLEGRNYLCLPSLDRCMPDSRDLGEFAIRVSRLMTPTYIHCANGHSRSALLMAMVMVLRKDSECIRDAFNKMVQRRPWVHYRSYQAKQAVYTLSKYCGVDVSEDNEDAEESFGKIKSIDLVYPQNKVISQNKMEDEDKRIEHQRLKRGHTRFIRL